MALFLDIHGDVQHWGDGADERHLHRLTDGGHAGGSRLQTLKPLA